VKVVADRDVCIGAGMCVMTAGLFDQGEDGIVVISAEEVPAEEQ
jgi:ferredoxin